jgi:hypothetical protein
MKAVCSKHVQAYDVGIGCPWCETPREMTTVTAPAAVVGAPALNENAVAPASLHCVHPPIATVAPEGFDSRKLTVDDMMRLSRFYAL